MSVDRTRVKTGAPRDGREQCAVSQGAPAPGNCQRKSSRGAGAAPLQASNLRPTLPQQAEPTLSSFLRDKSDLTNGLNSVSGQRDSGILGVKEFGDVAAGEPEFLSECSPRDKLWDGHRADADQVAKIYSAHRDFKRLGGRVFQCSLWLGFAFAPERQDPNVLTLKLRDARFCRVRLCPICQWRRALMWIARFYAALPQVRAGHPTARFIFLTLTWRNAPVCELRAMLRAMNRAWERLSQRESFDIVLGWIRTTEVTRANDGTAHPHFHVLLLVPSNYFGKNYLKQPEWVQMWRAASRIDYNPVVHIQAVKGAGSSDSIMRAVRETLKYSVKPSDMKVDAPWFLELTSQLRKLRFVASGGVLKNVLRPGEESEKDLLLLRDAPASDEKASMFFDWKREQKRYKRAPRLISE